jgi:hypothetical protein
MRLPAPRRAPTWLLTLLCALLLAACGGGQASLQSADALLGGTQAGDFQALVAKAEEHWAQRSDAAQVEQAIAAWEQAIQTQGPSGDERAKAVGNIYASLSRAHYFLADGHIRFQAKDPIAPDAEDDPQVFAKMKDHYEKGMQSAQSALLVLDPDYAKAIKLGTPMSKAVQGLGRDAVPALYWWATNLGKWALAQGVAKALGEVDNIKAAMDRVLAIQPDYFHYAPYRYFGAYYTKLPFPTGDLPKSLENFQQAVNKAPKYLGTFVLYAEQYAVKQNDKKLFRDQLEAAINGDPSAAPDVEPENKIEQEKAKLLLKQIEDLF